MLNWPKHRWVSVQSVGWIGRARRQRGRQTYRWISLATFKRLIRCNVCCIPRTFKRMLGLTNLWFCNGPVWFRDICSLIRIYRKVSRQQLNVCAHQTGNHGQLIYLFSLWMVGRVVGLSVMLTVPLFRFHVLFTKQVGKSTSWLRSVAQWVRLLAKGAYHQCWRVRARVPSGTLDFLL